jgi:hypothetical protein
LRLFRVVRINSGESTPTLPVDKFEGLNSPRLDVVDRVLGEERVPEQLLEILDQQQIPLVRRQLEPRRIQPQLQHFGKFR